MYEKISNMITIPRLTARLTLPVAYMLRFKGLACIWAEPNRIKGTLPAAAIR
jgi:hypothetical protein